MAVFMDACNLVPSQHLALQLGSAVQVVSELSRERRAN